MRTAYNKKDGYHAFPVAVFAALGAHILLSFVVMRFAEENARWSEAG